MDCYICGRFPRYSNMFDYFSVTIPSCYKDVFVNSFFPSTARLWNSLPAECLPLTYDLNGFKSRVYRVQSSLLSFLYAFHHLCLLLSL